MKDQVEVNYKTASHENGTAALCGTPEVDGGLFSNGKTNLQNK